MKRGVLFGILLFVVLIIVGSLWHGYNTIVGMDEMVDAAWAQVENQLKRRADLVPRLVNTVKGYASHEREIFEYVADARSRLAGASTMDDRVRAAAQFEGVLGRLLLIVERYPDLKANQTFQRLMDELAGTENRLSVERRRYNEAVRRMNTYIRRLPGRLYALIFNYKERIYFQVEEEEREAPRVEF